MPTFTPLVQKDGLCCVSFISFKLILIVISLDFVCEPLTLYDLKSASSKTFASQSNMSTMVSTDSQLIVIVSRLYLC